MDNEELETPKQQQQQNKDDVTPEKNLEQIQRFHEKTSAKKSIVPQPKQKRLIVDHIVMENFKSYQGRTVIGPFHKSFTSIVGPNGSGKSNLIESLLFIFGKKAAWMRLNKLHQLIHNSSRYQNQKKAAVEVKFMEVIDKGPDEYEIVPNSELVVRRSVNHASISKYKINGTESTQAEVIDTLKGKGIDLTNNRFLILQGEVEQISLMKPRSGDPDKPGLLEYLEDIIGSNIYKERIEELDTQYESLQETRREKGERMRITEGDLGKLQEGKNIAVNYIRKEKQIFQIKNMQCQIIRFRANREIMNMTERKSIVEEKIIKTKESFKELIKENEKLLKDFKRKKNEIEQLRVFVKKCEAEFQKLNERDSKVKNDLKFESENQHKFEERQVELEKEYQKIIQESQEIEKELPHKQKRLDRLTIDKDTEEDKLRQINNEVREKAQKVVKQKKEIQIKLKPYQNKIKELEQQLKLHNNQKQLMNQQGNDMGEEKVALQEKQEEILGNIQNLENVVAQIAEAIGRMDTEKKNQIDRVQQCKKDQQQLEHDMDEIKAKINQAKDGNQANQSRNHITQRLMDAQKEKELSGICGRLGDLAAIDSKYDVAISTACRQLDNIVVRKYEDAQKAVQYLRENQIGKATFIALDQMEQQQRGNMQKQFQAPNQSLRLFDLLRFKDEKYKVAFYFALQNTLVTGDLDTATKIAYGAQRYKVVTLEGQLIEASGVMSGGGKQQKGGMAHSIANEFSEREIQQMQDAKYSLEKDLDNVLKEKEDSQRFLEEIFKDEGVAKSALQKQKIDLQNNKEQYDDCGKKISSYEVMMQKKSRSAQEKKELDKKIVSVEKEIKGLQDATLEFEDQLKQFDGQIDEIGGQELKEQKELCHEINKQYEQLNNQVSKMKYKFENITPNIKRNEKEKSELKTKLERVNQKIEYYKQEMEKIDEEAMKILGRCKQAKEQLGEKELQYAQQSEDREKFEKILKEHKQQQEKEQAELDHLRSGLKKQTELEKNASADLIEHRTKYAEIIAQYDFLNELDEIAKYSVGEEQENPESNLTVNQGKEDIMEIEEEGNPNNKKKVKVNVSMDQICTYDVNTDLMKEELESIEKMAENIEIRLTLEEQKLAKLQSDTNINTINEFKQKYLEHRNRVNEFESVRNEMQEKKTEIDKLKKERFDLFINGFNIISTKLKETYQTLTNGGDAELELIDSLDPFSDGVNFTVRPPKKSWKQISKLSGGEKTLSSLSLVFALHYYKPTPLYFMDEIDAALDFKNVSIVANYVKERTKNAQFIIISLRNNMFELANKLVGVYKTFDLTKTVSIYPEKIMLRVQNENLLKEQNVEVEESQK